jgi:glucosamine 6-phosphate synthetase-like amidotransferase/phosphosugar isomerase protein
LRKLIISTGKAIEPTIEANRDQIIDLAKALANQNHYVFVGHGPNYATAMFGAVKLLEAAGTHAIAQDT